MFFLKFLKIVCIIFFSIIKISDGIFFVFNNKLRPCINTLFMINYVCALYIIIHVKFGKSEEV